MAKAKKTLTNKDKVMRALSGIKKGITAEEIASKTGIPVRSVRQVLLDNRVMYTPSSMSVAFGNRFKVSGHRKCRIGGGQAATWIIH